MATPRGTCIAVIADMASIGRDVTTVLFPGTARTDLTPENIAAITRHEGARLWQAYEHRAALPARLAPKETPPEHAHDGA